MFILILSVVTINLIILDVFIYKTVKNTLKIAKLTNGLNLTDFDDKFWED